MARPDSPVAKALSTPLWVALARAVYVPVARQPAELLDESRFPDESAIENHLIEGYLPSVYAELPSAPNAQNGSRFPADRAQMWLALLAREAGRVPGRRLTWWQMFQRPNASVRIAVALWLGFAAAALTISLMWLGHVPVGMPLVGLVGLVVGLACAAGAWIAYRRRVIAPADAGLPTPQPSWRLQFGASALLGTVCGLSIGLQALAVTGAQLVAATSSAGEQLFTLIVYAVFPALVTGAAAGSALRYGGSRPPTRLAVGLRSDWKRFGQSALSGLLCCVACALAFTALLILILGVERIAYGSDPTMKEFSPYLLVAAALLAFVQAMRDLITKPAEVVRAANPAALLREDGLVTAIWGLGLTVGVTAFTMSLVGLDVSLALAGIVIGLIAGVAGSAWARFFLSRSWLALQGQLPWRLMSFLQDAHDRGVLRQVGAAYEFRHSLLREHLVRGSADTHPSDQLPRT
jgi:hypothetical protein